MKPLPEVITLLGQYKEYKLKLQHLATTERQLTKAKILNTPTEALRATQHQLQQSLQRISNEMTFATPIIWIQYKYFAYQDEAQPILTLNDFRVHCSKPGYICTKRFTFLNESLKARNLTPLTDKQVFADSLDLAELCTNSSLMALVKDETFMKQWHGYEYHKAGERIAKWENYS